MISSELFKIDEEEYKVFLTEKNCIIYLSHELELITEFLPTDSIKRINTSSRINKIREEIELNYGKKLIIKYTMNDFVVPDNFYLKADGLYIKKIIIRNKNEYIDYVKICPKWLFVVADVYSNEYDIHQYEVVSKKPYLKTSKIQLCDKDVLFKNSLIITFLSNKLDVPVDDSLKADYTNYFFNFVQENQNKFIKKNTVPTLGWNDNFNQFAPYSKDLHIDYSKDRYNYFRNLISGFKPKGDKVKFINKMKKHVENPFADFAVSTAFTAPLLKILGVRSFLLNYYGKSKNQKSLSARIGLAAFGDYQKLEMSGADTVNVLKSKIHKMQNHLCYVDEIIQKGKNAPQINAYDIGNEKDRHRLDSNSQIKESKSWRTIVFCTSELAISKDNDMSGEINRALIFDADCRNKSIKNETEMHIYASDYYSFLSNNYGLLGDEYIQHIIETDNDEIRNIYKDIRNLLQSVNQNENLTDHINSIAAICTGNFYYRKFFFNEIDYQYSVELAFQILKSLKTVEELDPKIKMMDEIYNFYEIHKSCFLGTADRVKSPSSPIYGKYDVAKKEIYFILSPLKDYLERSGWTWEAKKELQETNLISYGLRRIDGIAGKRIIIPADRLYLKNSEYEDEERESIVNQDKEPINIENYRKDDING